MDFTSTNDSSKTTCNSSNILQKSNILVLRRPTGFEECRVVLNGSEADTKFLDCNGKWKNISERYALDAFQTNNNRYMNRAIIKVCDIIIGWFFYYFMVFLVFKPTLIDRKVRLKPCSQCELISLHKIAGRLYRHRACLFLIKQWIIDWLRLC